MVSNRVVGVCESDALPVSEESRCLMLRTTSSAQCVAESARRSPKDTPALVADGDFRPPRGPGAVDRTARGL